MPIPERFGRYRVTGTLGTGAMGEVYAATDEALGREVAIKVLKSQRNELAARMLDERFRQEARAIASLTHPNVVVVFDIGLDADPPYLVMERVAGPSLKERLATGALAEPEVRALGIQIARALSAAHERGIVHRDVKPANILIEPDGTPVLLDFGMARSGDDFALTMTGELAGTPLYMSPEQVRSGELDHQSDMFSLGVVLYELLTGSRPFSGDSLPQVFAAILEARPAAPSAVRPELGPEIDRILLRMLHRIPAERYPGWAELALDLAGIGRLSVYEQAIADSEKFIALRRFPPLKRLDDADIWELVHASTWRRLPPQTVLMREEDDGGTLLFLASGELKVTKQGRLLNLLRTGEYFGEMAYIKAGGLRRQATVESITDVLIAEFAPGSIERLGKNCQLQLSLALMHTLVDRLAMADERIAHA